MMHRLLAIVFSVLVMATLSSSILLFGTINSRITYAQKDNIVNNSEGQRVSFLTDDGVLIVGTYYVHSPTSQSSNKNTSSTSTDGVILLHMLGRNRDDWNTFASALSNSSNSNGYAVLSIDLRGHGDSINQNGNTISFQSFTPEDFNKMVMDVKAAKHFLVTQKNINPNNIAIVGASIGANVALNYASSDPSIKALVLLSPGLDYKGVSTSDAIKQYKGPIYIVTASKDPIAGSDPQILCNEVTCGNRLQVYQNSNSHGTDMFSDRSLSPLLDKLITSWLNTQSN